MTEPSIADRDFPYGSFYVILQLQCAKCDDQADLDTTYEPKFVSSMWSDMAETAKRKGWYVNKKQRVALCPACRKGEGL